MVVGDRTSNKVDGHVQNSLRPVCDYKSQTGLTWSYHQSRVVAPPVVRDCVPRSDASHDPHLQSPRLVWLVVAVSVRLLTIGEDEMFDQS